VDGDLVEDHTLYRRLAGYGLQLYSASTDSLVAYSDADWAGCPTAMQSTYGNEAEYNRVAYVVALRNLFT
ncbi:hypothetical protein Tco_1075694, partial [Tanacetum coccineum]